MELTVQELEKNPNFIDDGGKAYIVLLFVFQYLDVTDLLSAAKVSKVWNLVASDDIFWRTVCLKNCNVKNCEQFKQFLIAHGTRSLHLSNSMIFPDLSRTLQGLNTVTTLTVGSCCSESIKRISKVASHVTSFTAYDIRSKNLNLDFVLNFENIVELKLSGSDLMSNEMLVYKCYSLLKLKKLTNLSIKGFSNHLAVVGYLPSNIESLELGGITYVRGEDDLKKGRSFFSTDIFVDLIVEEVIRLIEIWEGC